jgi:hypothetical protein
MSWKKTVFYGGAVLLLAACADTTAPTDPSALRTLDRSANFYLTPSTSLPTSPSLPSDPNTKPINCTGYNVHVGIDGTIIIVCVPVVME